MKHSSSAISLVSAIIGVAAGLAMPEVAGASTITRNFQITLDQRYDFYLDEFNIRDKTFTPINLIINASLTSPDPGYDGPVQTFDNSPDHILTGTSLSTRDTGFVISTSLDASQRAFNTHGPINYTYDRTEGTHYYFAGPGYDYGRSDGYGTSGGVASSSPSRVCGNSSATRFECSGFEFFNSIYASRSLFAPVSQPETNETLVAEMLSLTNNYVRLLAIDYATYQELDCDIDPNCGRTYFTKYAGVDYYGRVTAVDPVDAVPEPSTIALICMALLSLFGFGMMRGRAEA